MIESRIEVPGQQPERTGRAGTGQPGKLPPPIGGAVRTYRRHRVHRHHLDLSSARQITSAEGCAMIERLARSRFNSGWRAARPEPCACSRISNWLYGSTSSSPAARNRSAASAVSSCRLTRRPDARGEVDDSRRVGAPRYRFTDSTRNRGPTGGGPTSGTLEEAPTRLAPTPRPTTAAAHRIQQRAPTAPTTSPHTARYGVRASAAAVSRLPSAPTRRRARKPSQHAARAYIMHHLAWLRFGGGYRHEKAVRSGARGRSQKDSAERSPRSGARRDSAERSPRSGARRDRPAWRGRTVCPLDGRCRLCVTPLLICLNSSRPT